LPGGHVAKVQKYIDSNIRGWLSSATILRAVDQQNLNHMGLTSADISVLDQRWRKEKLRGGGDLIDDVEEDGGVNVSQTSLSVSRANGYTLGAVTIGIYVDVLK